MKKIAVYLLAALFVLTGINHFWHPALYVKIMPPWIPWHRELVIISGVLEIVLGLLLLFSRTRSLAAWGLILLLIAVFPANIQMAIDYWKQSDPNLWIAILRLPLQPLLIWWVYKVRNR